MEFEKVGEEAIKVLGYLNTTFMKPDEKVAVLEAASNIIRVTLAAETMKIIYHNVLLGNK